MMKHYIKLSLLGFLVSGYVHPDEQAASQSSTRQLKLLDTIEVVIETLEGTEIVTRSDVSRPALQGTARTVDEQV